MSKGSNLNLNINNGFFDIEFSSGGVFLTVYPPIGAGKNVEVSEVLEKLKRKQVQNFDTKMIESAVKKPVKSTVKIAEPQEEKKIDASVSVTIAPDKMKAFITLLPPDGGKTLDAQGILSVLNAEGVTHGIDISVLKDIADHPVYNETICIAEGTKPINGNNGKVEFHFDIKKNVKPTILDDGTVDFRSLDLIESVRKGQKLCTLIPPTHGTKGITVTGKDIPALDGKPAVLPKGRNVDIDEDGQNLIAAIDGHVNVIDGKVSVLATYEVPADVDTSTGNIKFIGNVRVNGNVLSGFSIEAGGSIEVMGVVEGAVLNAEGDIILRRGMQGMGKGILNSGGNIVAKFIENSNISAKRDIKAEAIMHSNVSCGNKLELGGRKGLLVGGTCKVGKEVQAKVIGSLMGATLTNIEVGVDPSLRESYRELKKEIITIEENLKKAEQVIKLLKKIQKTGALSPDKEDLLAKSIRTRLFLNNRRSEITDEIAALERELQHDTDGTVKCFNYIYPGTKVTIGTCTLYVRETLQHCTLYRDGADVRVGPLG